MAKTDKQAVWLEVYLNTWNATEAARQAGYAHPRQMGSRLLADPDVMKEVQERIAEKTLSADETLVRLGQQARAEYSAYIRDDGSVDLPAMRAAGMMHLIKGVKPSRYGNVVEFYDAQTALLNIGRHHKLFTDMVDLSGEIEMKQNESALESILSRLSGIADRIRTSPAAVGDSTDESGTGCA